MLHGWKSSPILYHKNTEKTYMRNILQENLLMLKAGVIISSSKPQTSEAFSMLRLSEEKKLRKEYPMLHLEAS